MICQQVYNPAGKILGDKMILVSSHEDSLAAPGSNGL